MVLTAPIHRRMEKTVHIAIAAIIGGISLSSIVLVGIFAPTSMSIVPWIVGALSGLGIALGYFASASRTP